MFPFAGHAEMDLTAAIDINNRARRFLIGRQSDSLRTGYVERSESDNVIGIG